MQKRIHITPEEGHRINNALFDGNSNEVMRLVSDWLINNKLKVDQDILERLLSERIFEKN